MFGQFYSFVQPPVKAENGEYEVILTHIEERNVKGYGVLHFDFSFADGVDRVPNSFDLFDCRNPSDEKELRSFNIRASKIALCFGLHGGFNPQSYLNWVGLKGRVFIKRDKEGFLVVSDWFEKPKASENPLQ